MLTFSKGAKQHFLWSQPLEKDVYELELYGEPELECLEKES